MVADYSGDLVEKQSKVNANLSDFGVVFEVDFVTKTQYLSTFQRFFLRVFLSGYEKKLYLYRIWLEKLRKHFTNP